MPHDVFVSYPSEDKPTADAVCAALEARGIRCWIAPRDVLPSREYAEAIIEGIEGAHLMVLVFSSRANVSPHISREVERAVNKGIPIIPFRIEAVKPARSLEYYLSTPHWLDALTPPLERHLDYLGQTVEFLLHGGEPPAHLVESSEPPTAKGIHAGPKLILGAVAVVALAVLAAAGFSLRPGPSKVVPTPIAAAPTPSDCDSMSWPQPLAQALLTCGKSGVVKLQFSATCRRGYACGASRDSEGAFTLPANDQTVTYIDADGNLRVARENGAGPRLLATPPPSFLNEQPAWSPDGKYIAYVSQQLIKSEGSRWDSLYKTQLSVVDVANPDHQRVLLDSSEGPGSPARKILWPRWSSDGKSIYFEWVPTGLPGELLYSVRLPTAGDNIDLSGTKQLTPSILSISAHDLKYAKGFLASFDVSLSGQLAVTYCDGPGANMNCSLATWDGSKLINLLPLPKSSFLFAGPAFSPGRTDVFGYVFSYLGPNNFNDRLVKVSSKGELSDLLQVDRNETSFTSESPFDCPLAVAPDASALLMSTCKGSSVIYRVQLSDNTQAEWGQGRSAAWYAAGGGTPAAAVAQPRSTPFSTPAPSLVPSPAPTRTPAPPPPMILILSVRVGGSPSPEAQITAFVNGQACASETAHNGGLTLTLTCKDIKQGDTVTFQVNGKNAEKVVPFSSGSQLPVLLDLP